MRRRICPGDTLLPIAFAVIFASSVSISRCADEVGENPAGQELVFQANWDSLQRYRCPEWFRDAKFGIYAHWGPYSAACGTRNTDWYSHYMYIPGNPSGPDDRQRRHDRVETNGRRSAGHVPESKTM